MNEQLTYVETAHIFQTVVDKTDNLVAVWTSLSPLLVCVVFPPNK